MTGGTGLVGQYLQRHLDAYYVGSRDFDLLRPQETAEMFMVHRPEVVIHLAAKVGGISDNIQQPFKYLEDNVIMNTNVLKYARAFGVERFIGVLSTCIYPDVVDRYPMVEEDLHMGLPNEHNYGYGYSKRLLAVHIDIARKFLPGYSYIIPTNLYGEYETKELSQKHFVGALLEKIHKANLNGEDFITLYGDGTPKRQFMYADDLARIIATSVKEGISENMNISVPWNYSIQELAEKALAATGNQHLTIKYDTTMPNGQMRKDVDITKFLKAFPSFEFTSYEEGVKKTYNTLYGK